MTRGGTSTNPSLRFSVSASSGTNENVLSALPINSWVICHWFNDFDDVTNTGLRLILNGTTVNGTSKPGQLNLTNTSKLTIGSSTTLGDPWSGSIAYIAAYSKQDWFAGSGSNTVDFLHFARERTAKITGIYPQSASINLSASVSTRATTAMLDTVVNEQTGERRFFLVQSGWLRTVKHRENSGSFGSYLTRIYE